MAETRRRYEQRVEELGERLDIGTVETASGVDKPLEIWVQDCGRDAVLFTLVVSEPISFTPRI